MVHRGVRGLAALMGLALVAAACGGRLSEDQIRAELAADGIGATSADVGAGAAPGVDTGAGTGTKTDTAGNSGSPTTRATGSSPGAVGPTTPGDTGSGPVTDDPAAPTTTASLPAGGNGGATDVGVTETEIRIGNVSTLSGPVPGLFRGALVGTQAAFAYQNSQGGLFGRQFVVVSGDDAFDPGQNRARHQELADDVFAFVGSFSLFDAAGASAIESSGVVDVGRSLSTARQSLANSVSPQPFQEGWPSTGCKLMKERFGDEVVQNMAIFWGNADAARNNADWQRKACEAEGWRFTYEREFQATESNFTGDVLEMRRRDVQGFLVVFDVSGIARFFRSIHQQGFDPPLKYPSPAAYDSDFITLAGADAVEGTIIGQGLSMYLGEDQLPEIQLFNEWMARVDPNQKVDIFALYGWTAARLLMTSMEATGPEVTREAILQDLTTNYTSWPNLGINGADNNVSAETNQVCEMYMQITGGQFTRLLPSDPGQFHCDGTFTPFR